MVRVETHVQVAACCLEGVGRSRALQEGEEEELPSGECCEKRQCPEGLRWLAEMRSRGSGWGGDTAEMGVGQPQGPGALGDLMVTLCSSAQLEPRTCWGC